jgi:hypothetical protein
MGSKDSQDSADETGSSK